MTLTLARGGALEHDLDLEHDLHLDLDLGRALDLSVDLSLNLDRALDRDGSVDLARALARDLDLDHYLSLDRALDRDSAGKAAHMRMLVVAYYILITVWTARENRKPKIGQALANFDAFLERILPEISVTAPTLPEDVAPSIRRTRELLEASSHRPPLSRRDGALRTLACRVTSDVHDLVAPILTRDAPYDSDAIPCARIGLLATAAVISHLHGRLSDEGNPASTLVRDALTGLTAVQERATGGLDANEVLILARA